MSYILDALKSSDQDRKKGSVPNLQSQPNRLVPPTPPPVSSRRRSALLWLAPLIFAVIVGWWLSDSGLLRLGESSSTSSPSQSQSPTSASAPASASTAPDPQIDERVGVAESIESEPSLRQPLAEPAVNLDDLKDVKLDITPAYQDEEPRARQPMTSTADVPPASTVQRLVPAESTPVVDRRERDTGNASDKTASESVENPYEGIPHQRQLATALQAALPDLDISVHVHSPSPLSRLVRINGRTYREGDLVDTDLRLEAITRDGLVMTFRGNRFWRNVP